MTGTHKSIEPHNYKLDNIIWEKKVGTIKAADQDDIDKMVSLLKPGCLVRVGSLQLDVELCKS